MVAFVFLEQGASSCVPCFERFVGRTRDEYITSGGVGKQSDDCILKIGHIRIIPLHELEVSYTSCCRVDRSLIVLRSHIHALPSVAPVTATPGPVPEPLSSTN